jgi:DNA-binding Lrp family transcriptional regulator
MAERLNLDPLDARLLDALQTEFSIEAAPYAALAERLGVPESLVIRRVEALKEAGVIRKIGPVFDPGRMGFVTLLVAMKVSEDEIEAVGRRVGKFPEVTHNYQREHAYNLWFTIVAPTQEAADRVFEEAAKLPGVEAAHKAPALRRFKVSVRFQVEQAGSGGTAL